MIFSILYYFFSENIKKQCFTPQKIIFFFIPKEIFELIKQLFSVVSNFIKDKLSKILLIAVQYTFI